MSFAAIALRLLLVLALLGNGAGNAYAMARASMGAPAAPVATQAPAQQVATHAPCHGHDAAASQLPQESPPAPQGCCPGADCDCACLGTPVAFLAAPLALPAALVTVRKDERVASGHRTPRLPHLIRPPIG